MKLHIGGKETKEGWSILNIKNNEGVDYVGDISNLSQFKDNSIKEIYASHVVEHVPQKKVEKTFEGIYRVLSEKGKFYVSVPDMDVLCRIFIDPKAPPEVKLHAMQMMFGGQIDEHDFHYVGWNFMFMNSFLKKAGFKRIERVKSFSMFKDLSEYAPYGSPISLNIIAYK